MATNYLENPEERLVIKLASASVLEILKDLIPNYKIADHKSTDKTIQIGFAELCQTLPGQM
jgi:hypothetical protein